MTEKRALIVVAAGSESLETVTTANVLRRAGIAVCIAGLNGHGLVPLSLGVILQTDAAFDDVAQQSFDVVVLPGGEHGARAFSAHSNLTQLLIHRRHQHGWIAAICASPALVLSPLGLLDGKQATCYPSYRAAVLHYVDLPVVVDGHTITAQSPAASVQFALTIVERLLGASARKQVAEDMALAE